MRGGALALGFGIAAIAALGTTVASSSPDGLERVAADLGFDRKAATVYEAPLPDYQVPGVAGGPSGALAGLLGAGVVGGIAFGAGRLLRTTAGRASPSEARR